MNKFTPGPWVLDQAVSGWNLLANGANITTEPFDCSDADAELMASAPDMARALEAAKVALKRVMEKYIDPYDGEGDLCPIDGDDCQQIRAAIDEAAAVLVNAIGEG